MMDKFGWPEYIGGILVGIYIGVKIANAIKESGELRETQFKEDVAREIREHNRLYEDANEDMVRRVLAKIEDERILAHHRDMRGA